MFESRCFSSILEIPEASWLRITPKNFPFADYEFLKALETGQCLGRRTGWIPQYLTLWKEAQLIAACPWFIRSNSYGEYIFDFAWAQAYERFGFQYYPKLTSAIPFTPATGPKLLCDPTLSEAEQQKVMQRLLEDVLQKVAIQDPTVEAFSSAHALFIPQSEIAPFQAAGFDLRHSFQYHFVPDPQDENFENFLTRLRSKRRKEIRRERQQVQQQGIRIQRLTGEQLTEEHAILMYGFYLSTVRKMGGHDYLSFEFFREVFRTMKAKILFVLATDSAGEAVAGALNYFSNDTLFGRHWGCLDDYKSLHFEVCYYQGIEFVFERKMKLFEAGAQGEHKFQRGFLPRLTYSAHWIQDERFRTLIHNFLHEERRQIGELLDAYKVQSPFNSAGDKSASAD